MVTEIAYTYLPSDARAVRARRGDDVRYGLGVTKRPCGASLGLVGTCISVLIKRLPIKYTFTNLGGRVIYTRTTYCAP